jgi:Radical SAM superfamily
MRLSGLHLLLTYQCIFECDHCFVWGSPRQVGTMSVHDIREILGQAGDVGTIAWIYFEGGEPFLYYPVLVKGVEEAARRGFQVGIVTNAYWATSLQDAREWLEPFAGRVHDLSVSSDLYHSDERLSRQAQVACQAAEDLSIPVGLISVAQPEEPGVAATGQLPEGESGVMYRGRAAEKLAARAPQQAGECLAECPHEDLREPGRVHVDALGNVHICQGISVGNMFTTPLRDLCDTYVPESHPIVGPLLEGGPQGLAQRYGVQASDHYADACHMCYAMRLALRGRFPEILTPDQMYGT